MSDKTHSRIFYVVSHPHSSNLLTSTELQAADGCDCYNRPRLRQNLILSKFSEVSRGEKSDQVNFIVEFPDKPVSFLGVYQGIHSVDLLQFLRSAWPSWEGLGAGGRDRGNFHPAFTEDEFESGKIPPLVPSQMPLHRDSHTQRPGKNVMGAIGYYCTDTCTPIVSSLVDELDWDAAIILHTIKKLMSRSQGYILGAYAVTTHPGHHASSDSFGGYCYINHAAMAARYLQTEYDFAKVAVLDVDYHAGNGTVSIFYCDPSVLTISIHCDPDVEYPFNSGWADQTGAADGLGSTLNIPLPPGTIFEEAYSCALDKAITEIKKFHASALVVSLGLDTYEGDEVAVRRAGFALKENDYCRMGSMIGKLGLPTLFIQEGGYKMDVVHDAAYNVMNGFTAA